MLKRRSTAAQKCQNASLDSLDPNMHRPSAGLNRRSLHWELAFVHPVLMVSLLRQAQIRRIVATTREPMSGVPRSVEKHMCAGVLAHTYSLFVFHEDQWIAEE